MKILIQLLSAPFLFLLLSSAHADKPQVVSPDRNEVVNTLKVLFEGIRGCQWESRRKGFDVFTRHSVSTAFVNTIDGKTRLKGMTTRRFSEYPDRTLSTDSGIPFSVVPEISEKDGKFTGKFTASDSWNFFIDTATGTLTWRFEYQLSKELSDRSTCKLLQVLD